MTTDCLVDECSKPGDMARDLCSTHYQRWQKYGDPTHPGQTLEVRLQARLEVQEDGCIVWTGGQNGRGYGQIGLDYKKKLVHRVAWELANGPIPEGKQIDHTCWNRLCANVEHLRLADPNDNLRSKQGATSKSILGVRNVSLMPGGKYRVSVSVNGLKYGHSWATLEEAIVEAEFLREVFYGEFAGKG